MKMSYRHTELQWMKADARTKTQSPDMLVFPDPFLLFVKTSRLPHLTFPVIQIFVWSKKYNLWVKMSEKKKKKHLSRFSFIRHAHNNDYISELKAETSKSEKSRSSKSKVQCNDWSSLMSAIFNSKTRSHTPTHIRTIPSWYRDESRGSRLHLTDRVQHLTLHTPALALQHTQNWEFSSRTAYGGSNKLAEMERLSPSSLFGLH